VYFQGSRSFVKLTVSSFIILTRNGHLYPDDADSDESCFAISFVATDTLAVTVVVRLLVV